MEASLSNVPVYRRFLSGGLDGLRLPLSGAGAILAIGLALTIVWPVGTVVAATGSAILVAWLAARWLGGRLGTIAGLVQLTGLYLQGQPDAAKSDTWSGLLVLVAMGAFALANVAGRRPSLAVRWPAIAFYAAAAGTIFLVGPGGSTVVLGGCLLYLLLGGDRAGVRFLVDPWGIAVFVLVAGLRLAIGGGLSIAWLLPAHLWQYLATSAALLPEVLGAVSRAVLPWTPLALAAALVGVRQGHYATPFWRFLGCWVLVAPLAAALRLVEPAACAAMLLPPLTVMNAAGLTALAAFRRRGRAAWA